MKTLLLLGVGPLPMYESDRLYGFGIRAWQFTLPLLAAGHRVVLVTCEFGVPRESSIQIRYQHDPSAYGAVEHIPLPEPNPRNSNFLLSRIEEIVRTHRPDAVIAAGSTIATNLAASIKTDLPLWMDMFGDLFAEVQAKTPFGPWHITVPAGNSAFGSSFVKYSAKSVPLPFHVTVRPSVIP